MILSRGTGAAGQTGEGIRGDQEGGLRGVAHLEFEESEPGGDASKTPTAELRGFWVVQCERVWEWNRA